jgi:hypothetical protein
MHFLTLSGIPGIAPTVRGNAGTDITTSNTAMQ